MRENISTLQLTITMMEISMKWILFFLIILLSGCMKTQMVRVVTDIPPQGDPTFHTEYEAHF